MAGLDAVASERVALRARALRETAGTLTGHATGEADERLPVVSLLDDLRTVYATAERADRPGVWSEELCAGLAELRPELYRAWTPDVLASAVKPLGIETGQLNMPDAHGTRFNRRGVRRDSSKPRSWRTPSGRESTHEQDRAGSTRPATCSRPASGSRCP